MTKSASTLCLTCLLVALGVGVSGCNVFDASLLGGASSGDGLPTRPAEPDDGVDMTVAFRLSDVQLNSTVDWLSVGRNLDGLNTTAMSSDARECDPPSGALPPVDGAGGLDNAMGAELLSVIELIVPCLEGELGNSHDAGTGTLILWIRGWNGTASDSVVSVALIVAADGTSAAAGDVQWDTATDQLVLTSDGVTPAPDPNGDTNDYYVFRPDSFSGGTSPIPRLFDANGYVSNGAIVFRIPDREGLPLNAGIGSLSIRITDGAMVSQLNESLDAVESGAISGRFSLTDLLDAGESIGVCPGDTQMAIEAQFQQLLDVHSDPDSERGGQCTAMSMGIPYSGVPVSVTLDGELPVRAGSNPDLPSACDREPSDPPLCPS